MTLEHWILIAYGVSALIPLLAFFDEARVDGLFTVSDGLLALLSFVPVLNTFLAIAAVGWFAERYEVRVSSILAVPLWKRKQ